MESAWFSYVFLRFCMSSIDFHRFPTGSPMDFHRCPSIPRSITIIMALTELL